MKQALRPMLRALAFATAAASLHAGVWAKDPPANQKALVDRGRYIVQTAGCNDCHTPGYIQAEGKVDESLWLTGDRLGWRGPWGTTYATNLRLTMNGLTEQQWLQLARTIKPRPPMPWFNLHAMTEADHRALYAYVKALGAAGQPAPAWVSPDKVPPQPYVQFPQ